MPRSKQEALKRKKHRGRVRKEAPFPILTSEGVATNDPPCRYFTGFLQGCTVVVQHTGDMDFLYNMGFFGKGNLSRSEPTYDARQQRVNMPTVTNKANFNGTDFVQAIVTSKRKYLAHRRYKALSDDEESLYNEIVQQEQSQLSLYDGEEDEEEDEEEDYEEDEEEEEDGLDNSDIHTLSRYSFKGDRNVKLTPEELFKMPRSLLMALMTQVAVLSKEQIATFVRVPCGLAELEAKYRIMRAKQVNFLEDITKRSQDQQHQTHSSLSTLFSSLKNKTPRGGSGSGGGDGGEGGGGFGKKGIINLEDGCDDAVVVLNSDDENNEVKDKEEERKSEEDKGKKTAAKGWDDSDDEGDADFWGTGDGEKEEENGNKEKGGVDVPGGSMESDVSQEKCDGDTDTSIPGSSLDQKEGAEQESNSCSESIGFEKGGNGDEESTGKEAAGAKNLQNEGKKDDNEDESKEESSPRIEENVKVKSADDSGTINANKDKDNDKLAVIENKEDEPNLTSEAVPADSSLIPPPSSSSSSITTATSAASVASINNKGNSSDDNDNDDDDDDDDVICVEEESAKPAKLHQYLSQPSTGRAVDVKSVTFLSSITEEPKYVQTRVGFKSWDNVLHFNFTGDATHLPTGMAIHKDGDEESKEEGKSLSSSSTTDTDDKSPTHGSVYERVYPPISSLLASQNSKGSIMKQRHDPIPFLDLALYNLQQRFVSSSIHHSSSKSSNHPSSQRSSRDGHLSSTFNNSNSPFLQPQSNQIPQQCGSSIWSRMSQNQHNVRPSFSHSGHMSPFSSSSSSTATVTPSQLELYLKVFEEDTDAEIEDSENENQDLNLRNEKDKSNDEMLEKLHVQLSKTGLLKMTTASKTLDDSLNQVSDESISKKSALHVFNTMLSEYMSSQEISLEQELVLLRILMYDEKSVTANAIPREMVSDLKAKISPGQVSCLLERMDFVQICVENRRRDLLSSNDVITIDLSDDDDDDDDDNDDDEKEDKMDVVEGENNTGGDVGKGIGDDGTSNDKKTDKKKNDDSEEEKSKEEEVDNEREKGSGKNVVNGDNVVGGVKRPLDSSADCAEPSENKKIKSGEDSVSLSDENLVDGSKNDSCDMSDIQCEGGKLESNNIVDKDGVVTSSSLGNDGSIPTVKSIDSSKGDLGKDETEDKKGNESESDKILTCGNVVEDLDSKGKCDEGLLTVSGDSSKLSGVKVSNLEDVNERLDKNGVENKKSENGSKFEDSTMVDCVKDGLGVGDSDLDRGDKSGKDKASNSMNVNEELNEIYIGSSDDEEMDEENADGLLHRRNGMQMKTFSGNGSNLSNLYCGGDEEFGDNFVIANTSDENDDEEDEDVMMMNGFEGNRGWFGRRNQWRPCLKRDPYKTEEKLNLMLEEAFFLTYGLGCLRVLDQEMCPMTITSMWQRFTVIQEKFIPRYVAYHYFRSKGWVPKSGLKFGCDFTLYREGPPFFHGSYSVVVVPVKAGTLDHMDGEEGELDFSHRWTSWIALSGLNRVTEHVAKELMVCYVIFPKGITEEESKSPKCLTQFKVKEVVVSRWVSSREREGKDQVEEIP